MGHRIFATPVSSVYPHYVARVERKGRTQAEVDEVIRWLVEGAFPVKWTGTDLDAASAQTLVESVELAHHGIRRG